MKNLVPSPRVNGPYDYKFKLSDILYWYELNNIFHMGAALSGDDIDFFHTKFEVCHEKMNILSVFGKRYNMYPRSEVKLMGDWYGCMDCDYNAEVWKVHQTHPRYKNKDYEGKLME